MCSSIVRAAAEVRRCPAAASGIDDPGVAQPWRDMANDGTLPLAANGQLAGGEGTLEPVNRKRDVQVLAPDAQDDHRWLHELWEMEWGGDTMVSRGHVYRLSVLKSLIAKVDGNRVGAATYRLDDDGGCELVSINTTPTHQGAGIGTTLLAAVEAEARAADARRVWLITSNDNLDALRFYQRRGYRVVAVYPGAIDDARRIKPGIPLVGDHGIEVHDEMELAKQLTGG